MSLDLFPLELTYLALVPAGEVSGEGVTLVNVVLPTEWHRLVVSVFLSESFVSCPMVRIDRA